MTAADVFAGLTPLRYELIMADPPWDFANWSATRVSGGCAGRSAADPAPGTASSRTGRP